MANFELNPDLNLKLRASLAAPDGFLEDMGLVYALLAYEVIAPDPLFSVDIRMGAEAPHKVLPLFTTVQDYEIFLADLTQEGEDTSQWTWGLHALPQVLSVMMPTPIDSLGFNLKTSGDTATGNLAYFDKQKMLHFIETYSAVMNELLSPENQAASRAHKLYMVPAFVGSRMYGDIYRAFPTLGAPDGQTYSPIFDNLASLAKWYGVPDFVRFFKENKGQILTTHLPELIHPTVGVSDFGKAAGFTINPLDVDQADYEKTLLSWAALEEEL